MESAKKLEIEPEQQSAETPSVRPSQKLPPTPARTTPMMAQFFEIKANNSDCLLFYRMGDFYELFFEDAEIASRALGITLTKRGQHKGADIPMCGVPVRAADEYLQKLIRLGHRVAVCEQLEDPTEAKKRGAKAVVRRDIVRLVTPGTLTEDSLLDAQRNNYLAALARVKGVSDGEAYALAWIDLSTGAFRVSATSRERLLSDLARLDASEVLMSDMLYDDDEWHQTWIDANIPAIPLTAGYFDSTSADRTLGDYFGIATIESFGNFSRAELAACGAIVSYLDTTQVGQKAAISSPVREQPAEIMEIDPATRTNLELFKSTNGDLKSGLLATIDHTVTPAGARQLADYLSSPLTSVATINDRLDAVAFFLDNDLLREAIRRGLRAAADISRAFSRLALQRGGPRDLGALRDGIQAARDLAAEFSQRSGLAPPPAAIAGIITDLAGSEPKALNRLHAALDAALGDELPGFTRDGNFVRSGHIETLDEARTLRDESRKVIASLQSTYRDKTGVKSLKVRHNNVLGYFVEVPGQHGDGLMNPPLNEVFIHRQTLASATRFTTIDLGDLESRIAAAADRALAIELEIFEDLRAQSLEIAETIKGVAQALALLDLYASLAELAAVENWCRPALDDSTTFEIVGGRHPVVEAALKKSGEAFVPNDCNLGPDGSEKDEPGGAIWLLTGPNMAGKSTYLRQNALIAILAQMGSYVPAREARIGFVDRLFSRVGASDDLARGRSTFMVEMVETAAILNQAGSRSLVILDEIGRGTATFDGLSIAWATVEHLHEVNGSRALFATHYHELANLEANLERLHTAAVKVKEWEGDIVFLHQVVPGASDRSYGIQVARLAGLPPSAIKRAGEVLELLELGDKAAASAKLASDLPLFAADIKPGFAPGKIDPALEKIRSQLENLAPDEMTPRDAMSLIYQFRDLLIQGRPNR